MALSLSACLERLPELPIPGKVGPQIASHSGKPIVLPFWTTSPHAKTGRLLLSFCHLSGCTWLDAAIDVVGEHGYTILSDNGDGDGPMSILINDETLTSTRELIDRLRQRVATWMS